MKLEVFLLAARVSVVVTTQVKAYDCPLESPSKYTSSLVLVAKYFHQTAIKGPATSDCAIISAAVGEAAVLQTKAQKIFTGETVGVTVQCNAFSLPTSVVSSFGTLYTNQDEISTEVRTTEVPVNAIETGDDPENSKQAFVKTSIVKI